MTSIINLKTEYQPIMVDCETIGLTPNKNPVLQLALVSFDPVTFEPKSDFEIFLPLNEQITNGRIADAGTVEWWGEQNPEVLKYIMDGVNQAGPMQEQLRAVYQWVAQQCRRKNTVARSLFYAKPAHFDFPYVEGLFKEYSVPSPFHYRETIDVATQIKTMFQVAFHILYKYDLPMGAASDMYWLFYEYMKLKHPKTEDSAHNATADCHYQLKWLSWSKDNCEKILSYFDANQEVKGFLKEFEN